MKNLTDEQLILNIKSTKDQDASLEELIERHSGIYLEMVNAFSSTTSPFIDRAELIEDKGFKIYEAALKYDNSRGTKFSTYLGNETKWMCLNTYNKNKRKPLITVDFIENIGEDQESTENIHKTIETDLFDKVLSIISAHPDRRVGQIFEMRYIKGHKNKVMPWKKIGKKLQLSIQGCINIHNSAVSYIKNELKEDINFE
tara:strand:+ start:4508 stop:5107 length:600 start_codon:yes stop_codon:yes gene_type:complete